MTLEHVAIDCSILLLIAICTSAIIGLAAGMTLMVCCIFKDIRNYLNAKY